MFKISTKSRYGLRAIAFLAKNPKKISTLKEISEKEKVSLDYLEKILSMLVKNGFIRTKKGVGGGYILTKSPKKIKIKEILDVLEGGAPIIKCLGEKDCHCLREKHCVTKNIWGKIQRSLDSVLNSITLYNLIN